MTTSWKIFRIANIVQILLILALWVLTIVNGKFSLKSQEDVIGLIIFSITSSIVVSNSVNNILLLRLFDSENSSYFPRKVFFWCAAILNCLAGLFLILVIAVSYPHLKKMNEINKASNFKWMTILLSWLLLIGINGLYIFCQQVVLFIRIRKQNKQKNFELIATIGEQPE